LLNTAGKNTDHRNVIQRHPGLLLRVATPHRQDH